MRWEYLHDPARTYFPFSLASHFGAGQFPASLRDFSITRVVSRISYAAFPFEPIRRSRYDAPDV
jgi:hypothetical protein